MSRTWLKGAVGPEQNDSRWLLDPHKRGVPGVESMRRYRDADEVDLVIVGCGAGGGVLSQRLGRAGWKVVVLEAGPFWDPDRDWVSDEAGSHRLYWTENRLIGGDDPVELGQNNSGRGVGGSMIHYAGFAPRFHPSDFQTATRDGVGTDWPIAYEDLRPHYELLERELPVAGQHWPWGDPHGYPHGPHPVGAGALEAWRGAKRLDIELRVGPVAIANGAFGNRPHCIYRGFCLQGCKVNAKASPLVTHVPDALAHGVEIRADSMAVEVQIDERGSCSGVRYFHDGRERFQRAAAIAIAGYSIETPRLLLNSTSPRFPNGLANNSDQVGRYLMVQGAPQVAGRFPERLSMYKAPPPEISSEQFYETDPTRGFARGFAIQTVGPLPIGWAEHVSAAGHWGHALRDAHNRFGRPRPGLRCRLPAAVAAAVFRDRVRHHSASGAICHGATRAHGAMARRAAARAKWSYWTKRNLRSGRTKRTGWVGARGRASPYRSGLLGPTRAPARPQPLDPAGAARADFWRARLRLRAGAAAAA